MKSTAILTFLFAGTSFLYSYSPEAVKMTVPSYKMSKFRTTGSMPYPPIRIVIDKSDYELYVYDSKGWFATYPVVFGSSSLDDKRMEGDKKTPEGNFKIINKKPHNKWSRFMLIDYPNQESLAKFNERKRRGEIPKGAKIGGGVGIHGTWPRDDYIVDRYKNWTLGCISLKNEDMIDLYSYIPTGTPVHIKR